MDVRTASKEVGHLARYMFVLAGKAKLRPAWYNMDEGGHGRLGVSLRETRRTSP